MASSIDRRSALSLDADVLVVRSALPADLLDFAPRLRGIVRHGVGVDMIPMAAANARRLPVANVPGSNRHAVVVPAARGYGWRRSLGCSGTENGNQSDQRGSKAHCFSRGGRHPFCLGH